MRVNVACKVLVLSLIVVFSISVLPFINGNCVLIKTYAQSNEKDENFGAKATGALTNLIQKADLKIRIPGGSWQDNSIVAEVGTTLEFKLEVKLKIRCDALVATVQLPPIEGDLMFDEEEGSAFPTKDPLLRPRLLHLEEGDDGVGWFWIEILGGESITMTFRATIVRPLSDTVLSTVWGLNILREEEEYVNDSIQVTGEGGNNPPNIPSVPSGDTELEVGESATYSTSAIDPDGDRVQYLFDWGDGTMSDWTYLGASGHTASLSNSWGVSDTYMVKARARDEYGAMSSWSGGLSVTVTGENDPPNIPSVPSGDTELEVGESATYSTSAVDPDGNQVRYYFDWDDGTGDWTGYVNSGQSASKSHSWGSSGTYQVRAKAEDEHGAASGWSSVLTVTVIGEGHNYIEVDKKVWDQDTEEWVDEITATVGEELKFKCEIYNPSDADNLYYMGAVDVLPSNLQYVEGSSGYPEEIDWQNNRIYWRFKNPLKPHEKITIKFDAKAVEIGSDVNTLYVKAILQNPIESEKDRKDAFGSDSVTINIIKNNHSPELKVEIKKPMQGHLYIKDHKLIKLLGGRTVILGAITVTVQIGNNEAGTSPVNGDSKSVEISKVEFYVDNNLKATVTNVPYSWIWHERTPLHFRHTIKVKAYDTSGGIAIDEITVWKFF